MSLDVPSPLSRLVDQALDQGLARLWFSGPLESRFQDDKAVVRMQLMQRASWLSTLFALGLVCCDFFMVPDRLDWSIVLKLLVFAPVCVVGQMVLARYFSPWWREWGVAAGGLLAAFFCVLIAVASQSDHALSSLVVLNVVVVFVNAVGRFWPCALMSAVVFGLHVAAVSYMDAWSRPLGLSSTLLLVSVLVFTLYGTYVLERDERRAFLLSLQESELQRELSEATQAVARTARTDALTQLANRRHFDEVMGQVWRHAQTQRSSVALLLLDVDHFKAYNDLYGHQAGDVCLQAVATAISACMRKGGDLVARWGGEEFVVVMSGASLEAAQLLADRVRVAVLDKAILHGGSRCSPVLSVSIGVSAMDPGPESSLDELIRTADLSLYEAKARGRNRVWARLANPLSDMEALRA